MSVVIPKSLIKHLEGLGPRFCLVQAREKNPNIGGIGWQLPERLIYADDPRLQQHLQWGGNYGVVGGHGLIIIDGDTDLIIKTVEEKLPSTLTVKTGSSKRHYYYRGVLRRTIVLSSPRGKDHKVSHIKATGSMVVGPGSIHPNGNAYEIIKDVPLANITEEQLVDVFKPYMKKPPPKKTVQREGGEADFNVSDVVGSLELVRKGNEFYGEHPTHGSETGHNFWINPTRNCWHCFRHNTGGGPLLLLAVKEKFIKCEDATSGALKGEVYKDVVRRAVELGLLPESRLIWGRTMVLEEDYDE